MYPSSYKNENSYKSSKGGIASSLSYWNFVYKPYKPQCSAKGLKLHLSERGMDLTVWSCGKHRISLEIFKFGRSDHIFGKKLTEKSHFCHFTLVNGFLAPICLRGK